jgi:N,N'-diacetyllegionaminate synthase
MSSSIGNLISKRSFSGPPYVIAEIGVNHDGNHALALELVKVAAECGADAVKFQAFDAEKLAGSETPMADYQISNCNHSESQQDMLRRLEIGINTLSDCMELAHKLGLDFGCTPFDEVSLRSLEYLNVDFLKISSGDADNIPLIRQARDTGIPVIVSTGMCYMSEVREIIRLFREEPDQLAILHCVSAYPAPANQCNLRVLKELDKCLNHVGFSDHTVSDFAAIGAVALGSTIIEKHLTYSTKADGPDHKCSLDPEAMRTFINNLRQMTDVLGNGIKAPVNCEDNVRLIARKSIVALEDLHPGDKISGRNIILRRPAGGLSPKYFDWVLGKTVNAFISAGSQLREEQLAASIKVPSRSNITTQGEISL